GAQVIPVAVLLDRFGLMHQFNEIVHGGTLLSAILADHQRFKRNLRPVRYELKLLQGRVEPRAYRAFGKRETLLPDRPDAVIIIHEDVSCRARDHTRAASYAGVRGLVKGRAHLLVCALTAQPQGGN